jgi:hypothetical protein
LAYDCSDFQVGYDRSPLVGEHFPFHRFYGGRKRDGKELAVDRGHCIKPLKVQVRVTGAYVALDCEGRN